MFVSDDKKAIKAMLAIPELRLSAEITQIKPCKSWPWFANQANNKGYLHSRVGISDMHLLCNDQEAGP